MLNRPSSIACALFLVMACGAADIPDSEPPEQVPPDDTVSSAEPDYDQIFPAGRVVEVEIVFEADGWETITATPLEDIYVPAAITYDGVQVDNVAVRLKGNSSRWSVEDTGTDRYSLKVDFDRYDDAQEFYGIDKLNFNNGFGDATQVREVLSTELFASAGVPSPQIGYAWVSVNGETMGLYTVVEQVDKDFLRRHFEDDDGDLYKPEIPAGNLAWQGNDPARYGGLDLKTNEETSDKSVFVHFVDVLNNTPDEELEAALGEVFDVDGFLRYLAVSALNVNLDSILGPGHNYYLYEDRTSGRLELVAWDLNGTFGGFSCFMPKDAVADLPYPEPWCDWQGEQPVLVPRILQVPAYRAAYEQYLADFAAGSFAIDNVLARIDELANLIRPYVERDPKRQHPVRMFEDGLLGSETGRGLGLTWLVEHRHELLGD